MFDQLSLNWIRHIILIIRGNIFQRGTPEEMDFMIEADRESIKKLLAENNFTKNNVTSYYYKGEDLNMRRPAYNEDEWEWYQIHVRVWIREKKAYFSVHYELDPIIYPQEHINGLNYSLEPAASIVSSLLEDEYKINDVDNFQ